MPLRSWCPDPLHPTSSDPKQFVCTLSWGQLAPNKSKLEECEKNSSIIEYLHLFCWRFYADIFSFPFFSTFIELSDLIKKYQMSWKTLRASSVRLDLTEREDLTEWIIKPSWFYYPLSHLSSSLSPLLLKSLYRTLHLPNSQPTKLILCHKAKQSDNTVQSLRKRNSFCFVYMENGNLQQP